MRVDVAVLGSGPAGLAVAAACARHKLAVALVSPTLGEPWPNRYGVFEEDTFVSVPSTETFESIVVKTDGEKKEFERPYLRVDQDALRHKFLKTCAEEGVATLVGSAEKIVTHRSHHRVEWTEGELYCKAVVDASGHRSEFVQREDEPWGFQTAYGILFETDDVPFESSCVLIDYSDSEDAEPPSFLYGMKLGDGLYFAEETVLIADHVVDFDLLAARLKARLTARGVTVSKVIEEENCVIPMAGGLPFATNAVIPFGGAATMVHPATGYLLSNVLNAAPTIAKEIRDNLTLHTGDLAESVINTLWTDDARKRYALLQFGGRFLAGCDLDETRRFFDAFFALPTTQWGSFMSGQLSSREVSSIMLQVFKEAGLGTKAKLVGAGLSDVRGLLKGLF